MLSFSRDNTEAWVALGVVIFTFLGLFWRGFLKPILVFARRLSQFMDQVEEHFFAKDGNPSTFDTLRTTTVNHEYRITAIEAERVHPK